MQYACNLHFWSFFITKIKIFLVKRASELLAIIVWEFVIFVIFNKITGPIRADKTLTNYHGRYHGKSVYIQYSPAGNKLDCELNVNTILI